MPNAAVIGRVAVKVLPETIDFRATAKRELEKVESSLQIKAEIVPDISTARVDEFKKKLEDKFDNITAKVKLDLSDLSTRETQARLAVLSRARDVELIPRVNKLAATKATAALAALSGGRAITDLGSDFGDWVGNLDRSLPKLALLSNAFLNLGSSILASTANLTSFAGSLASVGAASLALPGIAGGLAIGVAAFAVSMKDFNKYFPQFSLGIGKANKAGEAWKHLQNTMSDRFWKNAADPIGKLLNSIFPQFASGLNKVSTDLGKFTGKFATSFKGLFNGELASMFSDLGASIGVAGKHTDAFAGILQKLGSLGAGYLPRLAGWVGDVSDNFDNWLGKNQASGRLQQFVDDGVSALGDLGNVLRYTGSSLAGLVHAANAAGSSTLSTLAGTMKSVAKTINGPTFQKALANAFKGAHDGLEEVSTQAGPAFKSVMLRISSILSNNLPIAGHTAGKALKAIFEGLDTKNVENTIGSLMQSIDKSITNLTPAVAPAVKALAGILRAAGDLTEQITGALAPAIEILGPKIASVADSLHPLIVGLGILDRVIYGTGATVLSHIPNSILIAATAFLGLNALFNKGKVALGGYVESMQTAVGSFRASIPTLRQFGTALAYSMHPNDVLANPEKYGKGYSAFLNGVGDNALRAKAAVGSFVRQIGPAVGQVAAFAAVSTGLASKMGLTNTASMALAGSLAGPWGAAIGAAIGLTVDFAQAGKGVSDALGQADTALDSTSKKLQQSASDAVRAQAVYLGTANGWKASVARITAFLSGGLDDLAYKAQALQDSLNAPMNTDQSMVSMMIAPTGALSGAMLGATNAASGLSDKLDHLNAVLTGRGNMRDYKASIDAVTQALKTNGKTLNDNTPKGRANAATLDQITASALRVANALNGPAKARFLDQAQAAIANAAQKFGMGDRAAQQFANRMLGISNIQVHPKIDVDDKPGRGKLQSLTKGLNDVGKKTVKPKVDLDSTKANSFLNFFTGNLSKTAKQKVTATVTVKDKASSTLKFLQGQLKGVSGKPIKINVTATDKTKPALASIRKGGEQTASSVRASANKATAGLNGMPGKFNTAGQQSMAGLAGGIRAGQSGVVNAASAAAAAAIAAARARLKIRSPSRVFKGIGLYLTKGFADGIAGGASNVVTQMNKLLAKISGGSSLHTFVHRVEVRLISLGKAYDKVTSKIAQVSDYVNGISSAISKTGSPVDANGGSFADIIANLTGARDAAKEFAAALTTLRDLKLNKTTMDELAQAGPAAALDAAKAIAASGKAGVDQINQLQSQLAAAATKTGNAAADVMFASGGHIVDGLLAGLKKNQKAIANQMKAIAETMVAAIRKALKIKSPSRVFRDLGSYVGQGFTLGIAGEQGNANKAILGLASERPKLPSYRQAQLALAGPSEVNNRTLNYYAAPGSSIDSEEDLFSAIHRGRSKGF